MFRILASVLVIVHFSSMAHSEPVGDTCRADVPATASLDFDDRTHENWYNRFWTGRCVGLTWCRSGDPNWNDVVTDVVGRATPNDKTAAKVRACELGFLIGLEWAKRNHVRCIDTSDLTTWGRILEETETPVKTIDELIEQASSQLGC